jgi:quinol monooxygenase YgiN
MTTTTDRDDVSTIVGAVETQLGSRTIPFAMIAWFRVSQDSQARVEQAFEKAVPPTLREPGVLAYQPHRDPTDTAGFVVYERWKSLDDLGAHLRRSYIAELRQEIDAVITGAPEFNLLRPL